MREIIRMILVLTVLSSLSGGILSALKNSTQEKIAYQQLKFEKEPAILQILKNAPNDPVADRFTVTDNDRKIDCFPGFYTDRKSVVFETFGKGYGGEVGVMVGFVVGENEIAGIGVTTHSETPGVGSKAKDDMNFINQFTAMPLDRECRIKTDGGDIDALSGATITSRAVCEAVKNAVDIYERIKPEFDDKPAQP